VLGGLAWFAAASAAAAAAPSLEVLIAFRVQQALAGALIVPNGVALLREAVPSGRLGSRLGLVGSTLPLAAALGSPLGGLVLALDGRQGVFLVNLPLLVVPLVGGLVLDSGAAADIGRRGLQSQRSGAALCVAGHAGMAAEQPGPQPARLGRARRRRCCVRRAFTWRELRHPDPVLKLRLFRRGPLSTRERRGGAEQPGDVRDAARASGHALAGEGWSSTGIGIAVAPAAFSFGPSRSRGPVGACRTGWAGGSPPPSGWA
jgi:MFS family permease